MKQSPQHTLSAEEIPREVGGAERQRGGPCGGNTFAGRRARPAEAADHGPHFQTRRGGAFAVTAPFPARSLAGPPVTRTGTPCPPSADGPRRNESRGFSLDGPRRPVRPHACPFLHGRPSHVLPPPLRQCPCSPEDIWRGAPAPETPRGGRRPVRVLWTAASHGKSAVKQTRAEPDPLSRDFEVPKPLSLAGAGVPLVPVSRGNVFLTAPGRDGRPATRSRCRERARGPQTGHSLVPSHRQDGRGPRRGHRRHS